ncbi:hypothetical protein EON65_42835 [archaeon]|nr:MAG: hypothetical protein EON65_42835 [archaeon]
MVPADKEHSTGMVAPSSIHLGENIGTKEPPRETAKKRKIIPILIPKVSPIFINTTTGKYRQQFTSLPPNSILSAPLRLRNTSHLLIPDFIDNSSRYQVMAGRARRRKSGSLEVL